jgi:SAM-dependent methyltransferase
MRGAIMSQFGDLYSKYYDLLYYEKDYENEAKYVDKLIKSCMPNAKTILDMGCGTGKHASFFCDMGYVVLGVDLSESMLKIAQKRCIGREDKLSFIQSNIAEIDLKKKYDVVVSLFHVMSYQNSNVDLVKALQSAMKHLNSGGIFIFDFWYGPAVLTDLPATRVKRLENDLIKITRIAEPHLNVEEGIVDVNFDIFIENKATSEVIQKKELHKMRYLFDTELEFICEKVGFEILNKYDWMVTSRPTSNSWNVVWVLKNIAI